MKITKIPESSNKQYNLYSVEVNGTIIGLLEKYKDTRTDKHPWKAFKGIGKNCAFLKAFYPEEGGKEAAIKEILKCIAS